MSDALERIKNRQRPEVPKRDPAMTVTSPEPIAPVTSRDSDIEISRDVDIQISTSLETIVTPAIGVKQTTLRLEQALGERLQDVCHQQQICREVLIEAMFLELMDGAELQERILKRANERQQHRTAVANHKRAVTMMRRVSS